MTDKINSRTPEEIKLRLACIFAQDSGWCEDQESCEKCEYNVSGFYTEEEAARDSLILIQQLERERDEARRDVDKLKHAATEATDNYFVMLRERDAAVEDFTEFANSVAIYAFCKEFKFDEPCDKGIDGEDCWQWRGVQEVSK